MASGYRQMTVPGDRVGDKMPVFNLNDPAVRAALYGNFGHYDDWREVVLANCQEIVRATTLGNKISEERIKNMAKTHPIYLEFLTVHFGGRAAWEDDVRAVASGRYGA